MNKHFKIGKTESILSWKSNGLSDQVIKPPTTNNSLAPTLNIMVKRCM